MKFLCPSCKAKYQISDEKIVGRTLKMDCRRCSHPIVIRGDKLAGAPAAPDAKASARPAPRSRGGSPGGAASSSRQSSRTALGADFRKNVAAPAAAASKPTALDQWHVAINDVPVGPMRREEIAQKITAGSIRPDSLCWREGFDEWRPLGDVPELATLLRRASPAAPPPPSRTLSRPATPSARPARPPSPRLPPKPRAEAESARPAARGNVVPIGGRLGAAAAPALEDFAGEPDDEPTRVGSSLDLLAEEERLAEERREVEQKKKERSESAAAPEPAEPPPVVDAPAPPASSASAPPAVDAPAPPASSASAPPVSSASIAEEDAFDPFASQRAPSPVIPPASAFEAASPPDALAPTAPVAPAAEERRRRGLPVGAWIAIAAAVPFGITLAVMVGMSMFPQQQPAVATNDPAPATGPREPIEAVPDPTLGETPTEDGEGSTETDPGEEEGEQGETVDSPPRAVAGKAPSTPREPTEAARPARPALDPEAAARLERFQDDGAGAATINVSNRNNPLANDRNTGGSELSSEQIRTVVNRERATVQRCYETATRAAGEAPGLRMDVDVVVGGSGTVTSATARGPGFGTLAQCIERTVRRWRFPATGATSRASIPFVFQGQN